MTEHIDIIHSPLEQDYISDGYRVTIQIYRGAASQWSLEVIDELGTSTVWERLFETDREALDEALIAIESEGIESFVTDFNHKTQAEEEPLPQTAASLHRLGVQEMQGMSEPLSDDELQELDEFFLYGVDNDECMTLDILDGYLHAIVIGPQTIMPKQWLPRVWGEEESIMPAAESFDQLQHVLSLVMRHYNSIVFGFEQEPPFAAPIWTTFKSPNGDFEDAEAWAYGFVQGIALDHASWKPLFDSEKGREFYRPIGLLGEEEFSPEQGELTETPEQREQLTRRIEQSLLSIHQFWLPSRETIREREMFKHMRTNVGRNETCPCGSGKKFKKCCGSATRLH